MTDEYETYKDEFAEALWIALICDCRKCHKMLFLDSIEELMDVDTIKWSWAAAEIAIREGWRYIGGKIICKECSDCQHARRIDPLWDFPGRLP